MSDLNQYYFRLKGLFDELNSDENQLFTTNLTTDLKLLKFTGFIQFGEEHFFTLRIDDGLRFEVAEHSLPNCLQMETMDFSNAKFSKVSQYANTFLDCLGMLSEFYFNLEQIDSLCFVLYPIKKSSKDNWRIFKLANSVFIRTEISPLNPTINVDLQLIGPSSKVNKYQELYNQRRKDWDPDSSVYQNLIRIFELLYFPRHNDSADEIQSCGICSDTDNEGEFPIITCENSLCDVMYHITCLKTWFAAKATKQFASVYLDKCPFCKEKFSVSFEYITKKSA